MHHFRHFGEPTSYERNRIFTGGIARVACGRCESN